MPTEGRILSPGAIGDVAAAVAVAEVAASRLAGDIANDRSGHATDRRTDGGSAYVAGNRTAIHRKAAIASRD